MIVSEVLTINVERCSPENPVALMWFNPRSGFDFWVFGKRQQISHEINAGNEFMPVIDYLENENGVQRTIQKTKFEKMLLGTEQITKQQVVGISYLLASPLIYLVTGEPASNDWRTTICTIESGSWLIYDTANAMQKIEFELIKPKIFTQST